MRKNLLANILEAPVSEPTTDFARRGAARSMTRSIEEMAENNRRMSDGEAIVTLDPAQDREFGDVERANHAFGRHLGSADADKGHTVA